MGKFMPKRMVIACLMGVSWVAVTGSVLAMAATAFSLR
jgi:hypothetical protein